MISYSTAYSHPLLVNDVQWKLESRQANEPNSTASRPFQQFIRRVLSAFRIGGTTTTLPTTTTQRTSSASSSYQQPLDLQEIPNFTDYSTYLLDSFMDNNSAIKFSYLQPNTTRLRGGNYTVISFLVPQNLRDKIPSQGFFKQFIDLFQFPWTRQPGQSRPPPSDTIYSNFPPLLEYFAQRIQAYYSIYKYTDESRLNNTIVLEIPDVDVMNQVELAEVEESAGGTIIENDEVNLQQLGDEIAETTTEFFEEMTTDYATEKVESDEEQFGIETTTNFDIDTRY